MLKRIGIAFSLWNEKDSSSDLVSQFMNWSQGRTGRGVQGVHGPPSRRSCHTHSVHSWSIQSGDFGKKNKMKKKKNIINNNNNNIFNRLFRQMMDV